jgi:hypothetical protein
METTDRSSDRQSRTRPDEERPLVRAHSTTEERTVFTEQDNGDGWIATDLTAEVDR